MVKHVVCTNQTWFYCFRPLSQRSWPRPINELLILVTSANDGHYQYISMIDSDSSCTRRTVSIRTWAIIAQDEFFGRPSHPGPREVTLTSRNQRTNCKVTLTCLTPCPLRLWRSLPLKDHLGYKYNMLIKEDIKLLLYHKRELALNKTKGRGDNKVKCFSERDKIIERHKW